VATCIVSYLDIDGLRHKVEVQAASVYEAAALAIAAFKKHNCQPGELSQLDVEVRTSVTHTVTVKKLREWVNGGARTPKEAIAKERLRELL
jgi:hypothetical protein